MSLRDDLHKLLVCPARGNGKLPDAPSRGAIPAARGDADYNSGSGSGGSLKPPFDEQENRQSYFDEQFVSSSDGVLVIVFRQLKSTVYKDQTGREIPFNKVKKS